MNHVFVLIGKERYMDATPHVLTAVQSGELYKIYDIAEQMTSTHSNLDILVYTYQDGNLTEVAVYDEPSAEFETISHFENE